ncbi:MAG: hypothetical protein JNK48_08615 [Bryobacterales bacterium]|nr:hypothetical protein [Bryobacterales bacterium]
MLIESLPVGSREAYDRVRRQVLKRYVEDDRGFRWGSSQRRIPRFLLNDLTRYWRTVTVDFVYKQRASDKKWALRNAKLRMSRKLVFAAGLLRVYFCALDDDAKEARESLCSRQPSVALLLEYMERQLALTPLELVAKACLRNDVKPQTARDIFQSYDRFLALLDDPDKREALAKAKPDGDLSASPAWMEVSKISRRFHAALLALFLQDDADLRDLTMEYGIF